MRNSQVYLIVAGLFAIADIDSVALLYMAVSIGYHLVEMFSKETNE